MKKTVHKMLPKTAQIAYTSRKLSTCFQIEDKSKFDHQHDLVYHAKSPSELCDKNYIGESDRCIAERVKDHNGETISHTRGGYKRRHRQHVPPPLPPFFRPSKFFFLNN